MCSRKSHGVRAWASVKIVRTGVGRDGGGVGEGSEGELGWALGWWSHTHTPGPGPQVYDVQLHIAKVVLADRGDYRLEVKAKDFCDSCGFNIDVEGVLAQGGGEGRNRGFGVLGGGTRSRGQGVPNWGDGLHAQSVRWGRVQGGRLRL